MINIFYCNLTVHYIILIVIMWSILFPRYRVWPPPSKHSWQYKVYWNLFYIGSILDMILIFQEFNSWIIPNDIRYFIGIPLILIGLSIVSAGIYTLGIRNTYGLKDGLINKGIYKFTRNPQYLGDIILLFGLSIIVNSLNLIILFLLTIIIFILMPFSEEIWLEEHYGNRYLQYKNITSRFI